MIVAGHGVSSESVRCLEPERTPREWANAPYAVTSVADGKMVGSPNAHPMTHDEHTLMSGISAHLRSAVGSDVVDEWAITEHETEQGRLRRRGLSEVWEQAMHRGDQVTAFTPTVHLTGTVDFVGNDYATVIGDGTCWDVRADRSVVTTRRASSGGHTVSGGSRTFKARLAEYESTGEHVTLLVGSHALEMSGRVVVAATDHVVLSDDGQTVVVPIGVIDAVRRIV